LEWPSSRRTVPNREDMPADHRPPENRSGRAVPLLKPLERRWREALLAAGHRPFAGRSTARAEDLVQLPPEPRILFIRLERIGDVLVSVPVLRALRRRYPGGRMDLLVSRANSPVRDAVAPFVDRLWCYHKTVGSAVGLLRALRQVRYDAIVDLIDHPSTTAQLVIRWCRPAAAVGLLHAESGLYTHAAPTLDPAVAHPVERFAQLLLPFGIDPAVEPLDLEYRLSPDDVDRARSVMGPRSRPVRLGVNISARLPDRAWGRDRYVELVRRVTAAHPDIGVSICGTPGDAADVRRIAHETGAQAVPPSPSFHAFAAILHEFDLLVTPDTAVVHLAAAWKLPTVALYQPEPGVAPWTPYHSPHRALVHPQGIPAITVDRVVTAVDELVALMRRPGAPIS
jgi:ADP-heptose:LPS heptosyltransferase